MARVPFDDMLFFRSCETALSWRLVHQGAGTHREPIRQTHAGGRSETGAHRPDSNACCILAIHDEELTSEICDVCDQN